MNALAGLMLFPTLIGGSPSVPLQAQAKDLRGVSPIVAEAPQVVVTTSETRVVSAVQSSRPVSESVGGLTGTVGYARAGGNCVNEPGVKRQNGNPIQWQAGTSQPYLGATVLFGFNHTGVISGIWSNGDIEVRHQNYAGGQHRFPRSAFRGFI